MANPDKIGNAIVLLGFALTAVATLAPLTAGATRCATTGEIDRPVDPALAPKIIVWVSGVEANLGLSPSIWRGLDPKASASPEAAEAMKLQAAIADWAEQAESGSVDSIFRQAVLHGVDVQYETIMVGADPANAATHKLWIDIEAARASACLALIRQP